MTNSVLVKKTCKVNFKSLILFQFENKNTLSFEKRNLAFFFKVIEKVLAVEPFSEYAADMVIFESHQFSQIA